MRFVMPLIFFLILTMVLTPQESKIDRLLKMDISELSNIEVTSASKKKQTLSDVPAKVRVITAQQIRERGYISLEDALGDLPGFQFRNILGFNSYSFLRGAPSQNNLILVLVDGVQINELNSGGFYGGWHFNLANVKQIEVVYGPSSVIYGTNAVSGIINVITFDPQDRQGGEVNLMGGRFQTTGADLTYSYFKNKKKIGFNFSGMYKRTEKADLMGESGDFNWTSDMENVEKDLSLDGKVQYKNFKMGFVFQDKRASRTTNYKSVDTDYLDSGTLWHIRFLNFYFCHKYQSSQSWFLKSMLYYRNATVLPDTIAYIRDDSVNQVGQVGYYRPNHLFGFEEALNYKFGDNFDIIGGIVLEWERLAEGFSITYSGNPYKPPPQPDRPDSLSNRLLSLYLQSQYKFLKYFQLTAGVRYDNSNYYGEVYTPRFGLLFSRQRLTSKILYMEAFRAPKPWDYTFGSGNTGLHPEKMRSFEVNIAYALTKHLRLDLSYYKNRINGVLTLQDNRWVNSRQLNTNGVEFTIDYIKNGTQASVNYTYLSSQYSTGGDVPEIAPHSLNIGITQKITKQLKLNLRGNYLGNRLNNKIISFTARDFVGKYFVLHGNLIYSGIKNILLQFMVRNIFNSQYFHTSNRPPDRYRQPQRGIYLKITYKLKVSDGK